MARKRTASQRPISAPRHEPPKSQSKTVNSTLDDFEEFTIAVSIEWDGKPPKMTWYDRLHRKGIRVRGGDVKEFPTVLARRRSLDSEHRNNGVVFQEGLYLVRNQDLANELAFEAEQFGATSVMIGRIFMDRFTVPAGDVEVLEDYFLKTSRRGRKPVDEIGRYTVTCLEELMTFEMELTAQPIACPSCESFRFYAHMGKPKVFQTPKWNKIDDLWDYWKRTRFDSQGRYEIPTYEEASVGSSLTLVPPEAVAVDIDEPVLLLPNTVKMTPELLMKIYDACYSLSTKLETDRTQGRLGVLAAYWNAGGDNVSYLMAAPEQGYDLIDLCILMRKELSKYL